MPVMPSACSFCLTLSSTCLARYTKRPGVASCSSTLPGPSPSTGPWRACTSNRRTVSSRAMAAKASSSQTPRARKSGSSPTNQPRSRDGGVALRALELLRPLAGCRGATASYLTSGPAQARKRRGPQARVLEVLARGPQELTQHQTSPGGREPLGIPRYPAHHRPAAWASEGPNVPLSAATSRFIASPVLPPPLLLSAVTGAGGTETGCPDAVTYAHLAGGFRPSCCAAASMRAEERSRARSASRCCACTASWRCWVDSAAASYVDWVRCAVCDT